MPPRATAEHRNRRLLAFIRQSSSARRGRMEFLAGTPEATPRSTAVQMRETPACLLNSGRDAAHRRDGDGARGDLRRAGTSAAKSPFAGGRGVARRGLNHLRHRVTCSRGQGGSRASWSAAVYATINPAPGTSANASRLSSAMSSVRTPTRECSRASASQRVPSRTSIASTSAR